MAGRRTALPKCLLATLALGALLYGSRVHDITPTFLPVQPWDRSTAGDMSREADGCRQLPVLGSAFRAAAAPVALLSAPLAAHANRAGDIPKAWQPLVNSGLIKLPAVISASKASSVFSSSSSSPIPEPVIGIMMLSIIVVLILIVSALVVARGLIANDDGELNPDF